MKKTMGCLTAAAALTLGVLVVAPGAASATVPPPTTVTFTGETPGNKPNGYHTLSEPQVLFSATGGAALRVQDFGNQSHGQAIDVFPDDTNALEMRLTGPTTSISMGFGNDDPSVVNATDQAQLTLYRGATQVAQVEIPVNANDIMDQTIGYSAGRLFNRAVFRYVDAADAPKNLQEVVDDVAIAPICTIAGGPGGNVLHGTPGNDVICGDAGNDNINGHGGNDLIYGGPGNDLINGAGGNDTILGSTGRDHVNGNSGSDDVRGGPSRDAVYGGPGNDVLRGGGSRDFCNGGSGHDSGVSCEVRRRIP